MPIFMDRHEFAGMTAMDVAEGHRQDLKIQHKFNCKALTYWYDEEREVSFCLIEAPRKEAVHDLHNHAHGLIPNRIIEVESDVVEAFLGGVENPKAGKESETKKTIGPAFRTVMLTDLKNSVQLQSASGQAGFAEKLQRNNEIIRTAVGQHHGREVEYGRNGIMAVFVKVLNAVECALDITYRLKNENRQKGNSRLDVAIGLSAGDPVTKRGGIFGEAVAFANRLCRIAQSHQIMTSSTVRDHYKKQAVNRLPGEDNLKFLRPDEESFLNQLMDVAEEIWDKENLSVTDLARRMGLSKSQLYRKTVDLVGSSPSEFMRAFRLANAARLIEKHQLNIAEIAYESGFSSPSYFAKCFQEHFGVSPSAYASATI